MSTDAVAIVLSEVLPTLDGKAAIGRITLNSPKTLNALNLEIILLVQEILHRFERDPKIAAVFIDGSGDKAFCAGGDVKSIRQRILDMLERGQSPVPLARVFFENEYKMDYAIHRYPKPVIIWGDGIIMGGGIGIAAGASHRIVTETTTLAMPEITIGLYPDVGASYFLPRMPGRVGLFLGMTAGRMKAADALYVNLADHFVPRANKQKLLQSLQAASFGGDASGTVTRLIVAAGEGAKAGPSIIEEHRETIDRYMEGESAQEITNRFRLLSDEDPFWINAKTSMLKGSPTSLAITFEQYYRSKGISIEAAFDQETNLSLQCCDR
ncbi:MAG: enoyl-CoA hydratase/isomerase family protein, partial [Proteobacteria bacterium]